MYWLLMYDLVDNYLERREPLREAHLALVRSAHQRGEILMAGALADPADAAILVFRRIRRWLPRTSPATIHT